VLESCRHFRNIKREYLKAKLSELATDSKNVSDSYIGASSILRKFSRLELI
jgi:hypothetical protein